MDDDYGRFRAEENKHGRLPVQVPLLCTALSHLPLPALGFPIPRPHVVVSGLHTPRAGAMRPVREPLQPLGPQNVVVLAGLLRERMTPRHVYKTIYSS